MVNIDDQYDEFFVRDFIQDTIGAAAGGPQALQVTRKRLANPVWPPR